MRNLVLLLTVVISAAMVSPKPFPRPLVRNGESAEYRRNIEGGKPHTRGWAAEMNESYQPVGWNYKIETTPDGILWTRTEELAGGGRRVMKSVIKTGSNMRVLNWIDTFYSPAGKVETKIEEDFTDPSLKFPEDMIPLFLFPIALRNTDLDDGRTYIARLWHNPMSFSRAKWRVTRKKTITVPAGQFDCYEVELVILIDDEGIIASTLQRILPKLYYYLNAKPPHNMVRFQLQIPGRELIYDELVKFEPGK